MYFLTLFPKIFETKTSIFSLQFKSPYRIGPDRSKLLYVTKQIIRNYNHQKYQFVIIK